MIGAHLSRHDVDVDIEPAGADDFQHFLDLAAEVEEWFGPMVDEPGFHDAVPGPDGGPRERFELPLERLPDWAG